ncbi:MAG TPA: Uma2 family endonuclease [Nocardioidaceae bacterium]|nr:Uma2 family endonuclease [Nocardioidaceae bacterium]
MGTVTTLPRGRALTRVDLDGMPDDGRRYELIDGSMVVTPAPPRRHQRVVGELYLLLRGTCPPDLEVFLAPFDVVLADDTVMQPDLLVARRSGSTERDLPTAPVLAVEELEGGAYVERAHVCGNEEYSASAPYPITVSPVALLG